MPNALMQALFGADGIGGQPGAVGNTLNNGIANTVLGGVGKIIAPVGNAAVGGLGDWVADVVTKNPLEILKNPASVLNDRGEPSWTRVLFPDFRRADMKAKEQASKALDLKATADSLSMLGDMGKFLQSLSPDQRAPYAQQAEEAGMDPEQIDLALGQANAADQESEIARQAILAEDPTLPPGLLKGLTPEKGLSTLVGLRAAQTTAGRQATADVYRANAEGRAQATFDAQDKRPFGVRNAEKQAAKAAAAAEAARIKAEAEARSFALAQAKADADAEAKKVGRVFGRKTKALEKGDFAGAGVTDVNPKNSDYVPNFLQSGTQPIPSKTIDQLEEERVAAEKAARKAAYAVVDEALPPTSRKNLAARRAARDAIKNAPVPDDRLALDPVIDETPLPTDPTERVKAAEVLGGQLLAAGFPPDKAAAELLRRGFKPEELPE